MSDLKNFYSESRLLILPITGQAVMVPLTGSKLTCTEADAKFQASLDGTSFFDFDKGMKANVDGGLFTRMYFRNQYYKTGLGGITPRALNVTVYAGTIEITDNRFNATFGHDPVFTKDTPTKVYGGGYTILRSSTVAIDINFIQALDLIGAPLLDNTMQQRELILKNNDGAKSILVWNNGLSPIHTLTPGETFRISTQDLIYLRNANAANDVALDIAVVYYMNHTDWINFGS
jgi:hypothetical protein